CNEADITITKPSNDNANTAASINVSNSCSRRLAHQLAIMAAPPVRLLRSGCHALDNWKTYPSSHLQEITALHHQLVLLHALAAPLLQDYRRGCNCYQAKAPRFCICLHLTARYG